MLEFDADQRRIMRGAALLHDIGKLAISNRILDKPGKLSDEEFRPFRPILRVRPIGPTVGRSQSSRRWRSSTGRSPTVSSPRSVTL